MNALWKALCWMAIGGAAGLGARQAHRAPVAWPEAPETRREPEPAPSRPPAFDFFGFAVESDKRASAPPPPILQRFIPIQDRCVAGFDGTSTLQDFRRWTKAVDGWICFEKGRIEETARASLTVRAHDRDIGFRLREFRRTSKERDGGAFTMKGTMEIQGAAREVEIPGTLELRRDGTLHLKGEAAVRMSEFGIEAPVTALVIRVADEIKVWFDLWARREGGRP